MEDEQQAETTPVGRRDHRPQGVFDLDRIGLGGESETDRESPDMGVDRQSREVHRHAANDVRGLSTHARNRHEVGHLPGDLAVVAVAQRLGHPDQGPGLVPVEAGGPNEFLDLGRIGHGEILGAGESIEQRRSHHVDPHVGALRRQDRRGEQFVGVAMVELAGRVGILDVESSEDLASPALRSTWSAHRSGTIPPSAGRFSAVRHAVHDDSGRLVSLEADPATDDDHDAASAAGLILQRRIDQLRVELPLTVDGPIPATRAFDPDRDTDAFLELNNRAFDWHPDQGDWTRDDLAGRMAEPWFDAEGFRLLEVDGRLIGFCWTKVHPATDDDPALGEIYVIAVDPDAHGRRHGLGLTLAGLHHLSTKGLRVGMLHVEHDNVSALALYTGLGFTEHDCHCWWGRDASVEVGPR